MHVTGNRTVSRDSVRILTIVLTAAGKKKNRKQYDSERRSRSPHCSKDTTCFVCREKPQRSVGNNVLLVTMSGLFFPVVFRTIPQR